MVNSMTVNQASKVLAAVASQVTGKPVSTVNPGDFISVAQTALMTGYDPVINALSQVWSKTVFATRPYTAKFTGLEMDMARYGNAMRKISYVSADMVDDARFLWPAGYDQSKAPNALGNGESVDMYKIRKQDVLQTNFYGKSVYQQDYTMFRDQFDVAFQSAEEFSRFVAGAMTERSNDRETYRESLARGLQLNYIGAIISEAKPERVVHLLTEYNAATGQQLTETTMMLPDNYRAFMAWCKSRIDTIVMLMASRTDMYQTVINDKRVLRHSKPSDLRLAMSASYLNDINAMVLPGTYHDDYLKYVNVEAMPYWQSPDDPNAIDVTPVMTSASGQVTTGESVKESNVFAVLHDRDAMGYAITNNWAAPTPFNAAGGYWNEYYHTDFRAVSDMTEKGVVFLLD